MQIIVCTSFSTATSSEGVPIAGTEKRLLPIIKAAGIKPE